MLNGCFKSCSGSILPWNWFHSQRVEKQSSLTGVISLHRFPLTWWGMLGSSWFRATWCWPYIPGASSLSSPSLNWIFFWHLITKHEDLTRLINMNCTLRKHFVVQLDFARGFLGNTFSSISLKGTSCWIVKSASPLSRGCIRWQNTEQWWDCRWALDSVLVAEALGWEQHQSKSQLS